MRFAFYSLAALTLGQAEAKLSPSQLNQAYEILVKNYGQSPDFTQRFDLTVLKAAKDPNLPAKERSHLIKNLGGEEFEEKIEKLVENSSSAADISGRMTFSLNFLTDYGCWCNYKDGTYVGHGQPEDEIDHLCKDFANCIECAEIDGEQDSNGETCNAKTIGYSAKFQSNGTGKITMTCDSDKNNDCAQRTCYCNSDLQARGLAIMTQGLLDHDKYKHDRGNFSPKTDCKKSTINGEKSEDCCGEYPNRKRYMTDEKECCVGKNFYSSTFSVCCKDGSVVGIGDDCP